MGPFGPSAYGVFCPVGAYVGEAVGRGADKREALGWLLGLKGVNETA